MTGTHYRSQSYLTPQERETLSEGAACKGTNVEAFYQENPGGHSPETREAIERCYDCGVRDVCIIASLEIAKEQGIWGGISERARRRLKKEANVLVAQRGISKEKAVRKVVSDICTSA